jgi:hypothetical protein
MWVVNQLFCLSQFDAGQFVAVSEQLKDADEEVVMN